MRPYHWELPSAANSTPELPGVSRLVSAVLQRRGVTDLATAKTWLEPSYEGLHDPQQYLHLNNAIGLIVDAIKAKQRITVYGDYDADGITAAAIVVETLTALGGNADWYIPERLAEGYGLNSVAVETIAQQGTQLLITVDCGTSNVAEIAQSKSHGLKVIVLDHHQAPPTLPEADAIINPFLPGQTYPFQGHSSGGVAFTLTRGLLQATNYGQTLGTTLKPGWEKWLLDLVAISTVADLMPLQGENRLLVQFGLRVLRKTRRPGLQALFTVMGQEPAAASETTIGFQIAPRLNAAGRLQHAGTALRLLLTSDPDEARELANELQTVNQERQRLTEMAVTEAMEQVSQQGEQQAYVAFAPHWSPGIVGLIAGRIVERVWRPVVVMTENGDAIVGSGRSVPGFNITAHLRTGQEHFLRFGGHAGACGFTLVTKDARVTFASWFQSSIATVPEAQAETKPLKIDAIAQITEFTPDVLDQLSALAPFGVGNDRPRFLIQGLEPTAIETVGQSGQHLRIAGRHQDTTVTLIGFRLADRLDELRQADRLDVVIEASWNEWNGRREPQFKIVDLKPAQ